MAWRRSGVRIPLPPPQGEGPGLHGPGPSSFPRPSVPRPSARPCTAHSAGRPGPFRQPRAGRAHFSPESTVRELSSRDSGEPKSGQCLIPDAAWSGGCLNPASACTRPGPVPGQCLLPADPRFRWADGPGPWRRSVAPVPSRPKAQATELLAPELQAPVPSRSRRVRLRSSPHAYPVREPLAPMTRWQGTMMLIGFFPFAAPTARAAEGRSIHSASSP